VLATVRVQRPSNKPHIRDLAADITAERWRESNDAVCFDEDGYLINGQHRMHAIVLANKAVRLDVKRGVPASSFPIMDIPRRRSGADIVSLEGGTQGTAVAAVVSAVCAYEHGRISMLHGWKRLSNDDMRTEFQRLRGPRLTDAVRLAKGLPPALGLQQTVAGVFYYIASATAPDEAELFVETLKFGERGGVRSEAAYVLRESLLRRGKNKRPAAENLALLIKTWNRRTRTSTRAYVRSAGPLAESMPAME
jgi:hypothetical protein